MGLILRLNEPLTRQELLEEVWGSAENISPNIVEEYVSSLREKLAAAGSILTIVTVRGVGYATMVTA